MSDSYHCLIIDDGSISPIIFNPCSSKVSIFRIPFNAGLGVSTNIALDLAASCDFDFFVRIDSDGQHPTSYIDETISHIINTDSDICIAERINHESLNTLRDFLSSSMKRHIRFLSNLVTGGDLADWNTGFFILNKYAIHRLQVYSYARYPEIELYLKAHKLNFNISTFPIKQLNRIVGSSSLGVFQSISLLVRFYLFIFKYFIEKR